MCPLCVVDIQVNWPLFAIALIDPSCMKLSRRPNENNTNANQTGAARRVSGLIQIETFYPGDAWFLASGSGTGQPHNGCGEGYLNHVLQDDPNQGDSESVRGTQEHNVNRDDR
jgi:hypothetical protein